MSSDNTETNTVDPRVSLTPVYKKKKTKNKQEEAVDPRVRKSSSGVTFSIQVAHEKETSVYKTSTQALI